MLDAGIKKGEKEYANLKMQKTVTFKLMLGAVLYSRVMLLH